MSLEKFDERVVKLEVKVENIREDITELKDDVKTVRDICDGLKDLTTELNVTNKTNSQIIEKLESNNDRTNWLIIGTIAAYVVGKILGLF